MIMESSTKKAGKVKLTESVDNVSESLNVTEI
ncbi:MAG: hypothetical protein CM1200mP1_13880 [Candidatus Neomarinimicrobiota bacterium]|nr:MAG: hypothetical protein CM1200mP1_13880 [Candidatus Neomarinimicrobiota bacterium]